MSGCICTQVGPNEYARTPVIVYQVENPAPGASPYTFKLGAPQYSSVPCGTGGQPGDVSAAPVAVSNPLCTVGLGASFPLSALVYTPQFDPGAGLFYSNVSGGSANGFLCPEPFVWAATADAAEWSSAPPPRNSAMVFDLYQFPLINNTPKWVAVGDGVFSSRDYGMTWAKHQDWSTSPINMLYVSLDTLVGFQQLGLNMGVLVSNDDGKTWATVNVLPSTYIDFSSALKSPFRQAPWGQAPSNSGTQLQAGQGGVNIQDPTKFGFLVNSFNSTVLDSSGAPVMTAGFLEFSLLGGTVQTQGVVSAIPTTGKYAQNSLISASPSWVLA